MRVITGSGKLVRKYVKNLLNQENIIIFPENGLDINEQSNFISDLIEKAPEFAGDIITFSSFIISDIAEDNVYILNEDGYMSYPDFNTFGASITKINFQIFKNKKTIGSLSNKKIQEFSDIVASGKVTKNTFFDIDKTLGESTEKFLLLKCLMDLEKK